MKTQYPDFEIIVVDNASRDQSVQFLKDNFSQIRLVGLGDNKGFAEGSNIGAKLATGEVLAFLNNDIEVSDDWLAAAITKLISDNAIAAIQCKIMRYDERDKIDCIGLSVDRYNIFRNIGFAEIDKGQYDNLEEIGACTGGAMIIWKPIFDEIGHFDDLYFMYFEDIDLSWRLKLRGYKICPAISSVVYHVGSGSSNTRSPENWNPSPFFAFLHSRNNIYCWLKNSSSKKIAFYWPTFFFANISIGLLLIPFVGFKVGTAYLRGLLWPLKHYRHILNQREKTNYLIKKQKDNILFVVGIVKESSHLSSIVKGAPSRVKHILSRNKRKRY